MTHRCLNSYYRALQNETVTSRSLRLQTAHLTCSLIPAALQNEPVFLSVDDTTVPKFGKKFDAVSLLHDHACHTGKPYVNGHCFVSLTLSVPVLNQREGKAPLIRYLAVPVGYRMWTKEQTKLELAGDLIEEVMPLLKDRQVLLLFDSWYAKSSLIEQFCSIPTWPSSAMSVVIRRCMDGRHGLTGSLGAKKSGANGFVWMISPCPGTWTVCR